MQKTIDIKVRLEWKISTSLNHLQHDADAIPTNLGKNSEQTLEEEESGQAGQLAYCVLQLFPSPPLITEEAP